MGTHPIFESDFDCLTENMSFAHGICGCFSNMTTCMLGWCCPCVLFGNTAAKVGQTDCLKGCLSMFVPCLNLYCLCQNRKMVREANGIEGSAGGDFACTYCCGCCALIQQAYTVNAVDSFGGAFKIARE